MLHCYRVQVHTLRPIRLLLPHTGKRDGATVSAAVRADTAHVTHSKEHLRHGTQSHPVSRHQLVRPGAAETGHSSQPIPKTRRRDGRRGSAETEPEADGAQRDGTQLSAETAAHRDGHKTKRRLHNIRNWRENMQQKTFVLIVKSFWNCNDQNN